MKELIEEQIELLQEWIALTNKGGWSTHLNKPMQKQIDKLIKKLYYLNK